MNLGFTISCAFVLCHAADQNGNEAGDIVHRPLIPYEAQLHDMVKIQIVDGNKMVSFFMRRDSTTAGVYRKAQSFGILRHLNNIVLKADNGPLIPNDSAITLLPTLVPESPANQVMPHQLNLTVFAVEQIEISVQIINGEQAAIFFLSAANRPKDVYERAVELGIMNNGHQFWLSYINQGKVLYNDNNPSYPEKALLDCIDPWNPHELSLIVTPIPEGLLLYQLFRQMTPNYQIHWWNYAKFCREQPWHVQCSRISANGVPVPVLKVDVPSWGGNINLENTPPSIRSMILRGQSVEVDFGALRFTSLNELTLDFREISGWDITGLSGSSLKVLRYPCYSGIQDDHVDYYLKTLTTLRAQNKIQLDSIYYAPIGSTQCMIQYDPVTKSYDYFEQVD